MDTIEERVIEWECKRVLTQFCLYNDRKQSDELANLFTHDGVWFRLGKMLKGRSEIRKVLDSRPANAIHLHILSNVLVTVIDASHSEASSYKSIYYLETGEGQFGPTPLYGPKWVSVYRDRFVRTEEGWQIARMEGMTLYERDAID